MTCMVFTSVSIIFRLFKTVEKKHDINVIDFSLNLISTFFISDTDIFFAVFNLFIYFLV